MNKLYSVFLTAAVALSLIGCAGSPLRASTGEYIDDRAITAKVKTKLIASKETRARVIDVDTFKGRVLLGGFVNSEQERDRAIALAWRVAGVVGVEDALILKTDPVKSSMARQNSPTVDSR